MPGNKLCNLLFVTPLLECSNQFSEQTCQHWRTEEADGAAVPGIHRAPPEEVAPNKDSFERQI